MQTTKQLTHRLQQLDASLSTDSILLAMDFDLFPDASHAHCDGIAVWTTEACFLYQDGVRCACIPMHSIDAFVFRQGVGCVFTEYRLKDGTEHILCRGTMRHRDIFAAVIKEMERYLDGKAIRYTFETECMRVCPKCGRPLTGGSKICPHCTDKKSYLLRLWQTARPYRWYLLASVLLYFIIVFCNLLPPYLHRILVDDYICAAEAPVLSMYILLLAGFLGSQLLGKLFSMLRSLVMIHTSTRVVVRLRNMVFDKVQMLSIASISKRTAGQLINRISGDTAQLSNFLTQQLGGILEQLLTLVAVAVLLFRYDWRLALFILLPTPLVMYVNRAFWNRMGRMYDRQWHFSALCNTILQDIFSGIRVVKAFGMEKREADRFEGNIAALRDTSIQNEQLYNILNPILHFLLSSGEYFLLFYVGNQILQGSMTIGEMSQFSSYVSIIYGPLRLFSTIPRKLAACMTSLVKIFEVIDEEPDVADKENAAEHTIHGKITFDNVSFGYNNTTTVLKNISFEVQPGEMIGIVGRSGVGKSTLINLVMRMYDVSEGSVKIDGIDIRDISQDSLRSQIGVVLQETFLFSGSIYDNIAYARPNATREEVLTAAKLAGAHSFIMRLPNAYNTKVGERGHNLSGGERQRVAIARALLRDPRILILDEATSSLDTETEKQIQDALSKLIADRTTLAIAHRLSTLRNATRILVLDQGKVAEIGTHAELMRQKGIYYGLVMAQRQMSKIEPAGKPVCH